MNHWSGTARLTRDPELLRGANGREICLMRIAVDGAGKDFGPGYFDLKAFNRQAVVCAEHLRSGREVAIEGRLRFEEWRGGDDKSHSRVYVAAERIEFLGNRNRRRSDGEVTSSEKHSQDFSPPTADGHRLRSA